MTAAFSTGLQSAVFAHLRGDQSLGLLVGDSIYDAPPEGTKHGSSAEFVTLGEETVRPSGTKTSVGSLHDFVVTVHSNRDGFEAAKNVAGLICDRLIGAEIQLAKGMLVDLRFLRARAQRGPAPEKRRIDLRFRAVVDGY